MERILLFLPSILIIGGIAIITYVYLKWITKKLGNNLKSVSWIEKNKLKISLLISSPSVYILAPAWEELVFRAPLIIAFGELSSVAWCGIIASSILFSLLHWFGNKVSMFEIFDAKENGENESDNLKDESTRLSLTMRKQIKLKKILHVLFTIPIGIISGYLGVKYQSIWICVGIHSLWNLIIPFVVLSATIVIVLICILLSPLWEKIVTKAKKYKLIKESS